MTEGCYTRDKALRVRPITLLLAAVALLSFIVLGRLLFGLGSGDDLEASSKPDAGRSFAAKLPMGRPIPKFEVFPADPEEPPPKLTNSEVPTFAPGLTEAQEPSEQEKLRKEAAEEGFLFRERGSDAIYIVRHGTRFLIPSQDEFRAMGLDASKVREVPQGALSFLKDRPPERTLWRERDEPGVYFFEHGQVHVIPDPGTFERNGHRWTEIRVVPDGTLKNYASGPPVQ